MTTKILIIIGIAALALAAAAGAASMRFIVLRNGDSASVGSKKIACTVNNNSITCGRIDRSQSYVAQVQPRGVVVTNHGKIVFIRLFP